MPSFRGALALISFALAAGGCRCDRGGVMDLEPTIAVNPVSLDLGKAKLSRPTTRLLEVQAASKAPLRVTAVTVEGDPAFTVKDVPETVPGLTSAMLGVVLHPTTLREYTATVVIISDDAERPRLEVPVRGVGAKSVLRVTPACTRDGGCEATVAAAPAGVVFAPEPPERLVEPPLKVWPTVELASAGDVALVVTGLAVQGADAAAFELLGAPALPSGGLELAPASAVSFSVRFKPTRPLQATYRAELLVESDDPDQPQVRVALQGDVRPNLPPRVCANVVRVIPGDGSAPLDYGQPSQWGQAPDAGYDFRQSRDVQPNSVVELSALSSADPRSCTSDPEDERTALTWSWEVLSSPPGPAPSLSGATAPTARLLPFATGEYRLRLTVRDIQLNAASTELSLLVAVKQDLVAQLSWTGFSGVDLDLHLVRPSSASPGDAFSGAFSYFDEGPAASTSGDINGFSILHLVRDAGFDFAWGAPGAFDDPRLNVDDTGTGALLENVSLNYPENDPACAAGPCAYKVMVHHFRDARTDAGVPVACAVDGVACRDGEACNCGGGLRCVAAVAPPGDAGVGPGTCRSAPRPTVRVFLKANPNPAAVIPLDTLSPPDPLGLGAPCQMLYLADVVWPQRGSDAGVVVVVKGQGDGGYISAPVLRRYGQRQGGSLQCSPNAVRGGAGWYAPAP